ncbi:bis(5'-nucleosyl)-tetraphosphatase [Lactobacillus johnsonii]|jgi:8-oxo-dGTP pyrophosphatase MutT (NUDIX family)|uniref:Bis(5'-nucleosyl)-tetraphosphatase [asymmetrical] n=2 Tax=Lactobacillus johnsonii TaxID=33959 RepID=A0A9X7XU17_LACJH|nr:NUDIX domain-containing protein [Lactobacillus johnsonii]AHA96899.1 NUDIX hydrolase [Lactobacillus johnsonii N6.2]QIA87123.1 NUDIX domain-containing protein [Lactobacillus johnsonii]TGY30570.1 NUDIX domain-containing protein [Lactobacillus johnsonii]
MKAEHSAGAIIWRKNNEEIEYLLIQSQPYKQFKSAWAFSKGHLEAGETERDAAKREVFEEVGLKPEFDFDFHESYSYKVTSEIEKTVTLFLAKYKADQKIKRQESEIRSTDWLNYRDAQDRIRKQNFKEFKFEDLSAILAKANTYLLEHE